MPDALSPEPSQGLALSGELQEGKWGKITEMFSLLPSVFPGKLCGALLNSQVFLFIFCSALWDVRLPLLEMFKGGGDGNEENQTEVLVSFKRKCALLEKIADCVQLRNRSQTFESDPKENSFNLWHFVFQAQSKNVLLPPNIFPVGMRMGNVLLPFRLGTGNPGVGNGKLIFSQTRLIPSSQQEVKGIHWCCLDICSGQVG